MRTYSGYARRRRRCDPAVASATLFAAANQPKQAFWPSGVGHDDLFDSGAFKTARDFSERHADAGRPELDAVASTYSERCLNRNMRRLCFACRGVSLLRLPANGFSVVRSSTRTGVPRKRNASRNAFSR